MLDKAIDLKIPTAKAKEDACRTRWVQRIEFFLEMLPAVHATLQAMGSLNQYKELNNWSWDGETITKKIIICRDDEVGPGSTWRAISATYVSQEL